MATLIMSAVAVTITVAVVLISVGSLRSGLVVQRGSHARLLADSCAEEAVFRLYDDQAYVAGDTLIFAGGSCEIVAITGSGNTDRVVQVTGTVDDVIRRVEVDIATVTPQVVLNSWLDVDSF